MSEGVLMKSIKRRVYYAYVAAATMLSGPPVQPNEPVTAKGVEVIPSPLVKSPWNTVLSYSYLVCLIHFPSLAGRRHFFTGSTTPGWVAHKEEGRICVPLLRADTCPFLPEKQAGGMGFGKKWILAGVQVSSPPQKSTAHEKSLAHKRNRMAISRASSA
jgi:hypothetical protein